MQKNVYLKGEKQTSDLERLTTFIGIHYIAHKAPRFSTTRARV